MPFFCSSAIASGSSKRFEVSMQSALRFCGSETGGIACLSLFPLAVGSHLFQHKGCILTDLIARNAVCLRIGDALSHIGTHLHHCTHRLSNGFRRCHDLFCHRHGLKVRRAHVNHHGTVHLLPAAWSALPCRTVRRSPR